MVGKKSIHEIIFDLFNYLLMILLMFVTVYPLLYVVFASFSDPKVLMGTEGFIWKPLGVPTIRGYRLTFQNPNILIGYRNTIFYVVVGVMISLFLTSIGAYLVSRRNFKLKGFLMLMITITLFFGGGMIPMFMVIKQLKIYNTVWAVLLPGAISSWNLIVMRTFFQGIPVGLEEAALIDGANDWEIFSKVIIPLSKPVLAVMVLYYGVGIWNSWFGPMIYLRNRELFPLQLFLREILMQSAPASGQKLTLSDMQTDSYYKELLQYTTMVVSTVPILCVYPFLQKYFVKGAMIGSIKG